MSDIFDFLSIPEIFHHNIITVLSSLVPLITRYCVPHLWVYKWPRTGNWPILISHTNQKKYLVYQQTLMSWLCVIPYRTKIRRTKVSKFQLGVKNFAVETFCPSKILSNILIQKLGKNLSDKTFEISAWCGKFCPTKILSDEILSDNCRRCLVLALYNAAENQIYSIDDRKS